MRLGGQVVNLVGANLLDDPADASAVAEVTVVKLEPLGAGSIAGAQMIDATGREAGSTPDHAVYLVAFLEQ